MFNFVNKYRWPYREDKVLGILAFLVLVVPLAFSFKTYENFETAKFVLWLVLLGWILLEYLRGEKKEEGAAHKIYSLKGNRIFFIILGSFVFWALLSTVFSADRINSVFGFYYRFTSGLLFYGSWALFLVFLLKSLDKERWLFILKILVFDALVVSLWGFLNSLGVGYYEGLAPEGFMRAPSLLGNPNFSTMFVVCILPFALAFGLTAKRFAGRLYYFSAASVMILVNLALASRGALLALAVSLALAAILLAWRRFRIRHAFMISAAIFACLVLAAVFVQVARPSALNLSAYSKDSNVTLRLLVWKASLQGIKENPLLGVGPGNFQIFFERYHDKLQNPNVYLFDDAHNLFLQMAVTTGLPFVLSFLALLGLAVVYAFRRFKDDKDVFALAGIAGLAAFVIAASFTPVSIPNFFIPAVLVAGLLPAKTKYEFTLPFYIKGLGVLLGVALVVFGASLLLAEYLFSFGYLAYGQGEYLQAHKLTLWAARVNPVNSLYYIYRTGSEIKLGDSPEKIEKNIGLIVNMHPNQARSFVVASNLYENLYLQTGQKEFLQQGIGNLYKALDKDHATMERYSQLGWLYYQAGDLDKSKQMLQYGLSLRESHLSSWVLLAKIYQQEGDRDRSLAYLGKAYELYPENIQLRALWNYAKQEPDIKKVPIQFLAAPGPLE